MALPVGKPIRRQLTWVIIGAAPWLCAGKCVPYNHAYDDDSLTKQASSSGGSGSGAEPTQPGQGTGAGGAVVPAIECGSPNTARLTISSFYFNPTCGCAESEGQVCTVNAGTEVIWTFADSEVHNVTSVPDTFGGSADSLSGSFSFVFEEPGEYPYGCTIHSEMRGFSIVAQ